MLVLSRKVNERILIGDNIEIIVVALSGNRVRLGVMAPKAVPVYRAELLLSEERREPESPDLESP